MSADRIPGEKSEITHERAERTARGAEFQYASDRLDFMPTAPFMHELPDGGVIAAFHETLPPDDEETNLQRVVVVMGPRQNIEYLSKGIRARRALHTYTLHETLPGSEGEVSVMEEVALEWAPSAAAPLNLDDLQRSVDYGMHDDGTSLQPPREYTEADHKELTSKLNQVRILERPEVFSFLVANVIARTSHEAIPPKTITFEVGPLEVVAAQENPYERAAVRTSFMSVTEELERFGDEIRVARVHEYTLGRGRRHRHLRVEERRETQQFIDGQWQKMERGIVPDERRQKYHPSDEQLLWYIYQRIHAEG